LTYHGVIPDELANAPWVPSQAVTVSQFERHMAMLAELGPVRPLGVALRQMQTNDDTPPAVCVTFDDGLADNATLAMPILRSFGHRATFFLTTGYIGHDQYLPNDMIRLLRPLYMADPYGYCDETLDAVFADPSYAKSQRLSAYLPQLAELWLERKSDVDRDGRDALRMMTWEQVRQLQRAGMEIGAHTVNHVILTREARRARRNEIVESIARVQAKTVVTNVPFAYPNGLPEDYEDYDVDLLKAIAVPYAVTERTGWNDGQTPTLELRRQCIGRHCSDRAFMAQLFGVNELLVDEQR
jgi:peptidoglycan/xylan/chitin deacetylase (PgdA/CDA1 family)